MSTLRTDLSKYAQLFLDDSWIADCAFVEREWHQPRKLEKPVIERDRPWDDRQIACYGSVRFWKGLFRAWYPCWSSRGTSGVCYAESEDGVHWSKPALDRHPAAGETRTNIVLVSDGGFVDDLSVLIEDDDPEFPLRMICWDSGGTFGKSAGAAGRPFGFYLARSRDGIAWEKQGMVLPGVGDRFNAVPEKWRGRYLFYTRGPVGEADTRARGRSVYRVESEDLRSWGSFERVLSSDAGDPAPMEYYSLMAYPYEGLLLGAIERFHALPDRLDCELTWSADGLDWGRTPRRDPFLPWGRPGAFDQSWVALPSSAPIPVDGRLWFYYSGRFNGHRIPWPHSGGAIGLATLRRDGFCSVYAGSRPGWLLTPPLEWPDGDLLANYDCRRDTRAHPNANTGDILVEAIGDDGNPLSGFSREECDLRRSNTDGVNRSEPELAGYFGITWQEGQKSLRELAGKTFQLKFHLREARLYSFKSGDWRNRPWK